MCYVFGVPLVQHYQHVGLAEILLIAFPTTATDPAVRWIPATVSRDVASAYHQQYGLPGHQVVQISNADGLWALWLELIHLAHHYEAKGIALIGGMGDTLEGFSRSWFIQQYIKQCHPQKMAVASFIDFRQIAQSVN